MTVNNYTAIQNERIDVLRGYVEEYCRDHNIDPASYLSQLDGARDPRNISEADRPVYEAYFELAYLQLLEVLNPELAQSGLAEVGSEGLTAWREFVGEDMDTLLTRIIEDDPELMAFFSEALGQEGYAAQDILAVLNRSAGGANDGGDGSANDEPDFTNHWAREVRDTFGLEGFDPYITQEELLRATEHSIMEQLQEMDMDIARLKEQFDNDEISLSSFEFQQKEKYGKKEQLTMLLGELERGWNSQLEMLSQLLKISNEMMQTVTRNLA